MDQLSFDWLDNFIDEGIKLNKLGKFKTKKCSKCHIEKEANRENFGENKNNKDNLDSHCRECRSKANLKMQALRREKGLCYNCNEKALPNRTSCAYHTVYNVLKNQQVMGRFTQLKTSQEKKIFYFRPFTKIRRPKT